MKQLLIFGLLAGFAGTLAAAHFVPWISYVRVPSQTSVIANGGRAERFVIHLPADRIHAIGPREVPLRSGTSAAPAADFEGSLPLLEHFKIRDSAGNVIGVAARHWAILPEGPTTAWVLAIPSRGAVVLSAGGEAPAAVETALASRGHVQGAAWSGELRVALVADSDATESSSGSHEFAGLDMRYTEIWNITGVGEDGEIRGTIELNTVSRRER